jgi:hypothetical protein
MTDVQSSSRLPKLFKRAKVIAIPKPGKDGSYPAHWRPILLLSVMYKLLEQLVLQCIQPLNETVTPVHQAGFHKHRSCTEQVMALTTNIEAGFQRQLKTGVVFVDLSVAYDTVWRDRFMLKFMRTVTCVKILNLLNNMLSNRSWNSLGWLWTERFPINHIWRNCTEIFLSLIYFRP